MLLFPVLVVYLINELLPLIKHGLGIDLDVVDVMVEFAALVVVLVEA
jgi:hypothetical protein